MARTAYNPGTPAPAVKIAENAFVIDSFRGLETAYQVDPEAGTCTCPHFVNRLKGTGAVCKHVEAVRAQRPFLAAAEKAALLTDAQITTLLGRYGTDPVIGGALRVERQRRAAAARPAIGTSVKTWGPTTEAEAWAALQAAA